jgi:ATP-dependent helicase HrpA
VQDAGFDWQVPGLRAELVTALLRAAEGDPAARRPRGGLGGKFGAELAAEGPESRQGLPGRSLREALARLIQPLANQPVSAADFDLERVPAHLRMNFRAVDERGRVVGSGRDLTTLQRDLTDRSRASVARSIERAPDPARPGRGAAAVAAASAPTERDGITTWDVGDLPEVLDTRVAGASCAAIPPSWIRADPSRCGSRRPPRRRGRHARRRAAARAPRDPLAPVRAGT